MRILPNLAIFIIRIIRYPHLEGECWLPLPCIGPVDRHQDLPQSPAKIAASLGSFGENVDGLPPRALRLYARALALCARWRVDKPDDLATWLLHMITLTENAARQIAKLQDVEDHAGKVLHLKVEAGGCSGLEYAMGFQHYKDGTPIFEKMGARLAIDAKSLKVIDGSEIDFDDGLHGKGFDIRNPNAKSTCGCGRSFS